MRDWDSGLIDFSSIPSKKNCALRTKLDWCSRELHLHSTFGPPQSYFSEFVTSPFAVPLPLFTNRYFPLFASLFCVCTSILLSYSILCEQITADWPLVIKCMCRSTFKCRYCSASPTRSDRLNPGRAFMYNTDILCVPVVKPTRCTVSQIYFILEQHPTCFRWSLRPSSGV